MTTSDQLQLLLHLSVKNNSRLSVDFSRVILNSEKVGIDSINWNDVSHRISFRVSCVDIVDQKICREEAVGLLLQKLYYYKTNRYFPWSTLGC